MILELATTLESLLPNVKGQDDSQQQFFSTLRKHGALALSQQQVTEILEILKSRGADHSSQLLREILRICPRREIQMSPESLKSIDELKHLGTDLVIIDTDLAVKLNFSEYISGAEGTPEIVQFGFLHKSKHLEKIQKLDNWLTDSTAREDVWQHYLSPLVKIADSIKIYDRYLIETINRDVVWRNGIKWFLGKVGTVNEIGIDLEIVSFFPDREKLSADKLTALALEGVELSNGKVSQLTLTLCDERASEPGGQRLQEVFHDRVLSFVHNGHSRSFTLGGGLEMFGSNYCRNGAITYYPAATKDTVGSTLTKIHRIINGAAPAMRRRVSVKGQLEK